MSIEIHNYSFFAPIQLPLCQEGSCCFEVFERIRAYAIYFFSSLRECFSNCIQSFRRQQVEIEQQAQPPAQTLGTNAEPIQAIQATPEEVWNQQFHAPFVVSSDLTYPRNMINLASTEQPAASGSGLIGLTATPHIGMYLESEGFRMCEEHLLVKLPKEQLAAFPEEIQHAFANYAEDQLDLYFIVFSDIRLCHTISYAYRNLLYHGFCYSDRNREETNYEMGIFNSYYPQDGMYTMPINRFGNVEVHCPLLAEFVQDLYSSPSNARFFITDGSSFDAFYSACKLHNNRGVAFFGVVVHSNREDALARPFLNGECTTLNQYKEFLRQHLERDAFRVYRKIDRLLTFRCVDQEVNLTGVDNLFLNQ